ncbi:hypothetical protein FSHL1_005404 [Fusarium sambucinum]
MTLDDMSVWGCVTSAVPTLSSGVLWCPLVSSGVLWCPLVSSGVLWCPLPPCLTLKLINLQRSAPHLLFLYSNTCDLFIRWD